MDTPPSAGGGLALVLAGPIADALGYRALFWLPMLVVMTAAVAAHVLIPSSGAREPGRFSWTASALLAGWLICLFVPLTQASVWGWTSARVLGLATDDPERSHEGQPVGIRKKSTTST